MSEKKLSVWQAACLVTGYSVGSGIMALPYLVGKAGILPGVIIVVISFMLSFCMHLLLAELSMGAPNSSQIVSIFSHYLSKGKSSKVVSGIVSVLIVFALFFAQAGFISGGAEVLASAGIPLLVAQLIFYAVAAAVVFFGLKAIGVSESISVAVIIVIIAALSAGSIPHLGKPLDFPAGAAKDVLALFGMTMFAFVAFFSVPQAVEGLQRDPAKVKKAILLGMGMNMAFIVLIVAFSLATSPAVTQVGMIGWSAGIGSWAQIVGGVFTVVAMLTTYWSNSLACSDMIREQFDLDQRVCWLLATVPSLLLVLFVSGGFLDNMRLAAGLVAIVISISLPVVFTRARKEQSTLYLMPEWMASKPMLVLLTVGFVLMAAGSLI